MSRIHEGKGDFHAALQEYRQFSQQQDTSYKTAINNSIPYIQELHEKERVEKAYNQARIYRLRLIIAVVMVILSGVLITWFLMNRVKRKQRELLEAEQTLDTFREMLNQQERQLRRADSALSERDKQLLHYDQRLLEQAEQIQCYDQVVSERDEKREQLRSALMNKLDIARKIARMNVVASGNTSEFTRQFQKVFGQDMMDWDNIYPLINDLYDHFVDKIRNSYPHLSGKDLQLCCFIRAGFRSDEQAVLLAYTQSSIRVKRVQLVKKMGFSHTEAFLDYLMHV